MSTNATLLACLLSGYPAADKCHQQLMAEGPKAVAEVTTELKKALQDDPGDAVRDYNNGVVLARTATSRRPLHPDSGRLTKATAAAEELGRLGEWKYLKALGTTTAAEGLEQMENPPRPVLLTLARWASDPGRMRRQLAAGHSLERYGPKARPIVPELIAMLGQSGSVRLIALETLESIGPGAEAAVPTLGKMIKDKDWADGVRNTLKAIKTPAAEKILYDNPPWTVAN